VDEDAREPRRDPGASPGDGGRQPAPRTLLERLQHLIEAAYRAAEGIIGEDVRMRAMALTYISLFALVPALVVAFSVVQAFTGMERISQEVHEFLLQNLAVGARSTLEPYLDRFVHNAHVARAGLVGGAILVWSAVSLFSNVERAVNDLWEVQRRRSLRMQALIYWMGLTIGPLLLAASATVSQLAQTFLQTRGTRVLALVAAGLLSSVFLTGLYLVVPNAKVRLRSAVVGGVAAGVGWEVAKWLFAIFVARFVRYNAIYGSVAAVPIFLTWLYLSWCIVLFGARLAFVVQRGPGVLLRSGAGLGPTAREVLAGQAMLVVARAFRSGAPAPGSEKVAAVLHAGAHAADVLDVLDALARAGLVKALAGGGLTPARDLETITLLDIRRALTGTELPESTRATAVAAVVRQADDRAGERLHLVNLRDLTDEQPPAATAPGNGEGPSLGDKPPPFSGGEG
jgi:membrane protein